MHWSLGLPEVWCGLPSQEMRSWSFEQETAASAWSGCPRAEWILWALGHAGAHLPTLDAISCALLRESLPLVPSSERWPPRLLELVELLARSGGSSERVSARDLHKASQGSKLARDTARKRMYRQPGGSEAFYEAHAVYHALSAVAGAAGLLSWSRRRPHLSTFHPESWVWRAVEDATLALAYRQTAARAVVGEDLWPMTLRGKAEQSARFAEQVRAVRWPLPVARPPSRCRPSLQVAWDFACERTPAGPYSAVELLDAYFSSKPLGELCAAPTVDEQPLVAALTFRAGKDERLWRELQRIA